MADIDKHLGLLYQNKSWFNKNREIEALQAISEIGTPFTVYSIFRYVFSSNKKFSHQAAKTIQSLMQKVKPSQWTQLYSSFSYIDIYKTKQVDVLSQFPDSMAVELLGVASLNASGYIRQDAIKALKKCKSSRKIPYLLLRLADWVPQVRDAALKAVSECFKEKYAESFLGYTYILDWMARVERVDLTQIRNQIIECVISSSKQNLYRALESSDANVRLFSFDALFRKESDNAELIQKGAKDLNPRIRWRAFKQVLEQQNTLMSHISLFLVDSSPQIRSAAMMAIPENQWLEYSEQVFQNIFSNSPSIRNTSRFLMKKHGVTSFADEYRSRLKYGMITPGILSGLAETGEKDDFNIILPYCSNPKSKVRSAAIAGLYRLKSKEAIPYLIEALKDLNSRVRRISVSLLCKDSHFDDDLVRKVLKDEMATSRIAALKVLCYSARWEALGDILSVVSDTQVEVRELAWSKYVWWYLKRSANNWTKPTESTLHQVEQQIAELSSKQLDIPNTARRYWKELPNLIESGKKIWKY